MKKVLMMIMAGFCLVLASCSGSAGDAKAVAEKISAGETLSTEDYTVMIDYVSDFAQKAQPYYNVINSNVSSDSKEYTDAVNALADMSQKAVYYDTFSKAIENADPAVLGKENIKKVEEYKNLEEMPLPALSDEVLLNPDVVGDIVDMPNSDTTGVIASGDGEVVLSK